VIDPRQKTDSSGAARSVDGRVVRGTRKGQDPVSNQWVVLHRVGRDRAGPVDSTLTGADGRFHIRYRATGDSSALYFVSTKFGTLAYFSSPLRAPVVRGDDATLTVFDTTSRPVAIELAARHLVIGMVQPNGRRPIVEVYDLKNDSTVTLIPRDSTMPVFTAHVPPTAMDFQLNASGDLAPDAISRRGTAVNLFVPLSPGIRQMAFNYELPSKDFPLTIPIERPTGVFEIMIQEPTARVTGTALREMPPVSAEGRVFRRFLGQDIAASSVITIDMPRLIGSEREKVYAGVGISMLTAMLLALVFASRSKLPRLRRRPAAPPEPASRVLVRTIASLDAEHERASSEDEVARAAYESKRAALKAELTKVLAAEQQS
jgi:hypothetical protein